MGLTLPSCSVPGPYVLGIPKAGSGQRMPWAANNVCASSSRKGNWALYRSLFCRNWADLVPSLHYVLRAFCALERNSMLYSIWGLVNKSDSTKQSLNQGCLSHSTISLAKILLFISCSHTFVEMASWSLVHSPGHKAKSLSLTSCLHLATPDQSSWNGIIHKFSSSPPTPATYQKKNNLLTKGLHSWYLLR